MTTRTTPRRRRPGGSAGPGSGPETQAPPPAGPATEPGPALDRFRALVSGDRPVLADGAMGTMLFAAGLQSGEPPETWNISHPDLVRRVHRGYLDAGSQIILTNTFGGNRLRLGLHRLEDRVGNLNRTAVLLARAEVASAGVDTLVAGDIGPSGEIMAPLGTLERETAIEVFAEQAGALVAGGADLIWIETMSDLAEIEAAIAGVRRAAPATPIIATMTFDTRGHTMMGISPEQAVEALVALRVDALGGNCGNGPDELLPVVERMAAVAPGLPIVAKSNVGMPVFVDARAVYLTEPAEMAVEGLAMRRAGAMIVGACCGSTPAHLAAMRDALQPGG